jgi:hypothetical protein
MKVSDEGLSALGANIKQLRSLTNLSLNLKYFNKNYFFEITKLFCEVRGKLFVVKFYFLLLLCSASKKARSFFFNTKINRKTKISDQGLSALGACIKQLSSLTNLKLNFWYLNLKLFRLLFETILRSS